jgi:uncharacterized cupin superfamily protein
VTLSHWDEVPAHERGVGPIAGRWRALGTAAGSVGVGLNRVEIPEGRMSTPVHVHRREEEIVYVLGGRGLLWQGGSTSELGPGDVVVHPVSGDAHALIGGPGGLDVLVFGPRLAGEATFLPRVGVAWVSRRGVRLEERDPFEIEAEQGLPSGEPDERPPNVVHVDEVDAVSDSSAGIGGAWKRVAREAGAARTGLNLVVLSAGEEGPPPHCHTAEEELFVILDGVGTLELWGPPEPGRPGATDPTESHSVRRGHVVSRPPGTRVAHCLRAGESPLTYLAYGTREPNDICYYPRSNKIFFRGVGLIARLEPLAYSDGEPG